MRFSDAPTPAGGGGGAAAGDAAADDQGVMVCREPTSPFNTQFIHTVHRERGTVCEKECTLCRINSSYCITLFILYHCTTVYRVQYVVNTACLILYRVCIHGTNR